MPEEEDEYHLLMLTETNISSNKFQLFHFKLFLYVEVKYISLLEMGGSYLFIHEYSFNQESITIL